MSIHLGNMVMVKIYSTKAVVISGEDKEHVKAFKLLGVIISPNLSSEYHVENILLKVAKRLYYNRYLVHAGITDTDLVAEFCSAITQFLNKHVQCKTGVLKKIIQ
jgi:hypothetical protein